MSRKCQNHPDSFCYICGELVLKSKHRNITPTIKFAYEQYFGCKLGDQDKCWAPHISCQRCAKVLLAWIQGVRKQMPFAIPMIWTEPTNHATDCYFCLSKICGFNMKGKNSLKYPNVSSAIRPVAHSKELPVPKPPPKIPDRYEDDTEKAKSEEIIDVYEEPSSSLPKPHLITQSDLNDLVRDLQLSKDHAELLGSRLQGWNLLNKQTNITYFRKRDNTLREYFYTDEELCVCTNINGLMETLGMKHEPKEWRLFIDASKSSLKTVLLHIGNVHPSIPIAYSTTMKESYDSLKMVLSKIQYEKYKWHVCGDLKVIGILLGLQMGYTKYCCFLCEWDSRARNQHYSKKVWAPRHKLIPGQKKCTT